MSLIFDFAAGAIATAVVVMPGIVAGARKERERAAREKLLAQIARENEETARRQRQEAEEKARIEAETARVEEEARGIVRGAHMALEAQKAAGYGPWLTCLLRRAGEPGRRVTPGIALQAVRMCLSDLAGSRYNLQCLYDAQAALEEMTGEGE